MSLFEIEEVKPKKRKFPKGLLLAGVISAIASLGLAVGAFINLKGDNTSTVEFGTGVIVFSTACLCSSRRPFDYFCAILVSGTY